MTKQQPMEPPAAVLEAQAQMEALRDVLNRTRDYGAWLTCETTPGRCELRLTVVFVPGKRARGSL